MPKYPRPDSDFLCKDCHSDFSGYMAREVVWKAAGLAYYDNCCQPCLSKRLNRPLVNADYRICALNFMSMPEFCTEENYRKLYAKNDLDYDQTKAQYMARCARLGVEPKWEITSVSSQTSPSAQ